MNFLVLAAAAAVAPSPPVSQSPPDSAETLYQSCLSVVRQDAGHAVELADRWKANGGGVFARQCLGQAYAKLERWVPAAVAFEQAAREAERTHDDHGADYWVQSGNAWLAASEFAKAQAAFDAALTATTIAPELRGEIHLDRARAAVGLNDLAAARVDIDKGLELVRQDPFAWYLSAALALREKAVPRARTDIARAVDLAPDDADVLLLAGDVADTVGETDAAQAYYQKVVKAAPESPAGKAAIAALKAGSAAESQTKAENLIASDTDQSSSSPAPGTRDKPEVSPALSSDRKLPPGR